MKINKRNIYYLLLFCSLFSILYYYIQDANYNQTIKLPVLNYVKPFEFITQDNQKFTEKSMTGKIWVVSYFFTSCQGICPNLTASLKQVQNEFIKDTQIYLLTHTCQPEVDSVRVLKKYSQDNGAITNKWFFVTGDKEELYKAARNSYLLDDPNNNRKDINDQFLHTQFFALVDQEGRVRGQIYDGLKRKEVEQLILDIKTLEKEEK